MAAACNDAPATWRWGSPSTATATWFGHGEPPGPARPGVPSLERRSAQADPDAVKAVYDAELPLPHTGVYAILVLTRIAHGLIGSSSQIAVAASSPPRGVSQRPPAIATDALASVHGDVKLLTTRIPPDDMHAVSLDQVLGKRPIDLLFSTPRGASRGCAAR
jgi:hypothetical protein